MANRVVVITGASSGIGAALAERLAGDGAAVALVARRADALQAVCARCGPDALPIVADMTRRADAERAVAEALARFGHIDVWVNNVGRGISRPPTELTDADIDEMMLVNVKTALYGMQAVLPHFKQQGHGHIVNVSSLLGRVPMALFRSAYNGAKHFLNALTANVREEVAATHPDIQVSLVSPGVVRTEFGVNAVHGGPDSRTLPNSQSAEEVADVIASVIASRRPDVYTRAGARQMVLGYLSELAEDAPATTPGPAPE
ncbi:MAG TPA: SDR family NAD(P)-dependent oxidoreductase [Vicinamibacterales bacterium]|nr:SDR family NAD(P)-dependent oxidoreductase [Vicinamibacterales bacterium]